jgi:acetolactate synthase-1/2/3 large subunit
VVGVGAIAQPLAARTATLHAIATLGEAHHVPVLCTYKARGAAPDSSSWCAGVATGATIESPVLQGADLIIGIGLDPVELIPAAWPYDAPVVLLGGWPIDDSVYFGPRMATEVVGELSHLVEKVSAALHTDWLLGDGHAFRRRSEEELRAAVPSAPTALTPQEVVEVANGAAASGTIATVDAGAHMLVAVPLWTANAPGELLISSGLATMGFALPAAIAAALVHPDRRVVCFTGDGGIGMALAELETVARLGLPITIVVFNDSTLSLIAAKQHPTDHGGELAVRYRPIDFAAVAQACGLEAERIHEVDAYDRAVRASFARSGPTLLDVQVDPSAYSAVLDAVRGARPADLAGMQLDAR